MSKRIAFLLCTLFCISVYAQTIADAQKAYVAGNWKEAADAYEAACPKEPKDKQDECYLWNILALSQTGSAKSFKTAGMRLDSLIQATNPQKAIYSDLMMTSAQFRMYLGKHDKAAEDLIHAIETSKPQHAIVLKKVCQAIQAKAKSEALAERCRLLDNPDSLTALQAKLSKPAEPSAPVAATPTPKDSSKLSANSKQAKPAVADSVKIKEPPQQASAPVPAPATPKQEPTKQETPEKYWTLQLGAFGTKSNADLLVSNLKKQKIVCTILEQPRGERILYLVQTGKFDTKEQAVDFAANKLAPLKIEFQPLLKR